MRQPSPDTPAGVSIFEVRNEARGTALGAKIHLAGSSQQRRVGLLKHAGLAPDTGLWINPCEAIHTFGMRFPIDVAFLDSKLRVVKVRHAVGPQRISVCWRATSVLELPAGTLAASQTQAGDALEIRRESVSFENIDVRAPLNA